MAGGGEGKDKRLSFYQDFICGGFAGVASRTITSPLDVVKILAQVGTAHTQGGFIATFQNVYREEGMKAFWKGNGIACVRLFPYSAIQFSSFSKLKAILSDERGKLSAFGSFTAGSISGIVATCAVYPTDMVKTRLTIQHGTDPSKAKYHGIADAFGKIYKEEGMAAFYRGMSTSVLGVIPFAGGTFMAYEILSGLWGKPKSELHGWQSFTNGCLAGAFAQTFSFPFDTIRKKLQAQAKRLDGKADAKMVGADVEFNGMVDCFRQTVKKNGILGLWKGTTANLAKVAPYAGLMFLGFESAKKVFLFQNGFTVSPWSDLPKPGVDQRWTPAQLKAELAKQAK
jgi:solute carrier family 25 protein 43